MTMIQSYCTRWDSDPRHHWIATHPPCDLRNRPCASCNELADIETQIEQLHSQLKHLHERHRQARLGRNHAHSPLIHRFPHEIVNYIFTLAFPPREKPPCFDLSSEKMGPLVLGKVCHTWRQLALSTPKLWCDLSVDIRRPNFPFLDHQVEHAGMAPLSIHLFISSHPSTDQCIDAMAFVVSQLHRAASLCMALTFEEVEELGSVTDVDYPRAAPLLEEFHLHYVDTPNFPRVELALEPPRPRHLILESVPDYDRIALDWSNISRLTLGYCGTVDAGLISKLLASEHLKQLAIWLDHNQFPQEQEFVNRSIEDLTLGAFACSDFIFTWTTLPLLQKLELYFEDLPPLCPMICGFLRRSNCPLRVLIIKDSNNCGNVDGETAIKALLAVLENTNALQQLSLQFHTRFLSSDFESLAQRFSSRDRGFLPSLQTLCLQADFVPSPIAVFLDIVEANDHSSDSPSFLPLDKFVLELDLTVMAAGHIPQRDILRIHRLRAAGKTVSIMCVEGGEADFFEYWRSIWGL